MSTQRKPPSGYTPNTASTRGAPRWISGQDQRDERTRKTLERAAARIESDSPATLDALDVPPSPDIATLETAAESLARFGDIANAVAVWAVILRLRNEVSDAVT